MEGESMRAFFTKCHYIVRDACMGVSAVPAGGKEFEAFKRKAASAPTRPNLPALRPAIENEQL